MMHCRTVSTSAGRAVSAEALRAVLNSICRNIAARASRGASFYGIARGNK